MALQNLLSTYAVDIEVENTDDIEGLIEEIIKANNNLTDSNKNGNWELMGQDIKKLQELINSLEIMKQEQDEQQENNNIDSNTVNEAILNETNIVNNTVEQIGKP